MNKKFKGESFKIWGDYFNVKFESGTIDVENLKSVYLDVRFWFTHESNAQIEDAKLLMKKCKRVIAEESQDLFYADKFLSNLHFPEYSEKKGPCFVKIEFTLFRKPMSEKLEIIFQLNKICDLIYNEIFEGQVNIVKKGTK
jgi:hypothetical protein